MSLMLISSRLSHSGAPGPSKPQKPHNHGDLSKSRGLEKGCNADKSTMAILMDEEDAWVLDNVEDPKYKDKKLLFKGFEISGLHYLATAFSKIAGSWSTGSQGHRLYPIRR